MNTGIPKICAAVFAALMALACAASPCRADDTAQRANRTIANGMTLLQTAAKTDVDLALLALERSYKGSSYAGNEGAESIRRTLVDQGQTIKTSIASLLKESAAGEGTRGPGATVALLSKAQMTSVVTYRWIRATQEMSNLAQATSGRKEPDIGEYLTNLIETHEAFQDVAGEVIQQLGSEIEAR